MVNVLKRDGTSVPLDINKISKALEWASEDLKGVSTTDIEVNANLNFYDGMLTSEIHDILIKTTKDMISLKTPNYDKVASHLMIHKIYKEAFHSTKRVSLREIFNKVPEYDITILSKYTVEEISELDNYIKDIRDFNFSLAGIEQLVDKYLLIDNDDKAKESPQLLFMAIAMDIFKNRGSDKISYVKKMYNALSLFDISLPTPMMKSLRTYSTDYASCITIKIGDTIDSWTTGKEALVKHTVASAGIGVDISDVASIGDKVKKGKIVHGGKIPLLKAIDADIQMSTQNGRRGQAVAYINFFDPEIVTILSLKSPRTETAKRINDLKYAIKMNKVWYQRVKEGKDIALFSTRKYPKLQRLFESKDIGGFTELYNKLDEAGKAEGYINAREYASLFVVERTENGVYYIFNIDEANSNTCYLENVTQSNICMEFISPNKSITSKHLDRPDVGVCILSNVNQGTVGIDKLPKVAELLVFALNEIKDRQVHPTPQANAYVRDYSSLGIGFANSAYFLAKNGARYVSKKAFTLHDEWMEHFQYELLSASCKYAKEKKSKAPKFNNTSYKDGILPIDRYNKNVDKLVKRDLSCDWKLLKDNIEKYGLYNCTVSMIPPSETSSVIGGMTSSLEPIKDLITIKSTKGVSLIQLAPEAIKLSDKYDYAFDRKDMTEDFIKHLAITQKWVCMGISGNTFYNSELYSDKKIPEKKILSDLFLAKYYGLKTLYYSNVFVEDEEDNKNENCSGGGCEV